MLLPAGNFSRARQHASTVTSYFCMCHSGPLDYEQGEKKDPE